jgi:preprotein translocase subunit Sss1
VGAGFVVFLAARKKLRPDDQIGRIAAVGIGLIGLLGLGLFLLSRLFI